MKCFVLSLLILCYAAFVIIGGLIIMVLERNNEKTTIKENADFKIEWLKKHTCVNSEQLDSFIKKVRATKYRIPTGNISANVTYKNEIWNVHTSIYFSTTVVTTIGYGNITPRTQGGRIFCVFFGLIGIPFALVIFAEIGVKLSLQLTKLGDLLQKRTTFCTLSHKHVILMKLIRYCFLQCIMFVILMLIPAIVFSHLEKGWSYYESLYYSFVTLTTIGFGDYVAGFGEGQQYSEIYRIAIACWIVIGLAWMSSFIASASDAYSVSLAKVNEKAQLTGEMKEVNTDKNSVSLAKVNEKAQLTGEMKEVNTDKNNLSGNGERASSDNNDSVITREKQSIE